MKPDGAIYREYLGVLQRIKTQAYFGSVLDWFEYNYRSPVELSIFKELVDKKIIESALPRSRENIIRVTGDKEESTIKYRLVDQSGLEGMLNFIRHKVEPGVGKNDNKTLEQTPPKLSSNRELRRKLNEIIGIRRIEGKEKLLLMYLAKNFKPNTMRDIKVEVESKDLRHLVMRVRKKLKRSNFSIETHKVNGIRDGSYYKLVYHDKK